MTPRKTVPPARSQADHQSPQEREVTGKGMVEIDWRGHHLVIDSDPNHMSGKTLLAFEQDKILTAISGLLGDGWPKVEHHTIEQLAELFELVNKALGFEPGESEPSPA
jgi:hypothetical protein